MNKSRGQKKWKLNESKNRKRNRDKTYDELVKEFKSKKKPKIILNREEFKKLLQEYNLSGKGLSSTNIDGYVNATERIVKWEEVQ